MKTDPGRPVHNVGSLHLKQAPKHIVTVRKRSLGQVNVFTPVRHSVHRGEGISVPACITGDRRGSLSRREGSLSGGSVPKGVSFQGGLYLGASVRGSLFRSVRTVGILLECILVSIVFLDEHFTDALKTCKFTRADQRSTVDSSVVHSVQLSGYQALGTTYIYMRFSSLNNQISTHILSEIYSSNIKYILTSVDIITEGYIVSKLMIFLKRNVSRSLGFSPGHPGLSLVNFSRAKKFSRAKINFKLLHFFHAFD